MHDLSDRNFSVAIDTATENPSDIDDATRRLAAKNVKVILTSLPASYASEIRKSLSNPQTPIIFLSDNPGALPSSGFYAFVSNPTDGIIEAATFAAAMGARKTILLAPPDFPKGELEHVRLELKAFLGNNVLVVRPSAPDEFVKRLRHSEAFDMLVVVPGLKDTPKYIHALLSTLDNQKALKIILPDNLAPAELASPDTNGALVCRFGNSVYRNVGAHFISQTGLPATLNAAYSYDATALLLTLAKKLGPESIDQEHLTSPTGFKGATGLFRFEKNGRIKRNCDIFKVVDGNFVFYQAAPEVF